MTVTTVTSAWPIARKCSASSSSSSECHMWDIPPYVNGTEPSGHYMQKNPRVGTKNYEFGGVGTGYWYRVVMSARDYLCYKDRGFRILRNFLLFLIIFIIVVVVSVDMDRGTGYWSCRIVRNFFLLIILHSNVLTALKSFLLFFVCRAGSCRLTV